MHQKVCTNIHCCPQVSAFVLTPNEGDENQRTADSDAVASPSGETHTVDTADEHQVAVGRTWRDVMLQ